MYLFLMATSARDRWWFVCHSFLHCLWVFVDFQWISFCNLFGE